MFSVLPSESPSSKCTKLHTVEASNNRDHPRRSLHYYCVFTQNRSQKIFNRGLYVCPGGIDILKFGKNSWFVVFTLVGLKFCLGGLAHQSPRGDGTVFTPHIYMDVDLPARPVHGESHI